MQYKGIREGIRRPLLGYVSLFFVFLYFCEKKGVLNCKESTVGCCSGIPHHYGIWNLGNRAMVLKFP